MGEKLNTNKQNARWRNIGGLAALKDYMKSGEWEDASKGDMPHEKTMSMEDEEEIISLVPGFDKLDEINRGLGLNISYQDFETARNELPKEIKRNLKHCRDKWSRMKTNRWSYRNTLEDAIASGRTDLSDESCVGYVLDAVLSNGKEAENDADVSLASRIASEIIRENANSLLFKDDELEKYMARDKNAKSEAMKSSIFYGTFPVGTPNEPNLEAKRLIEESGVDPNRIMRNAFLGYKKFIGAKDDERLEAYDNFFGLSNRLIQMMDEPYSGLAREDNGEFYLEAKSELNPQWNTDDMITKGLRAKLKERYSQMLSELVEEYDANPEIHSQIEDALTRIPEMEQRRLMSELSAPSKNGILDFQHYFRIKTMTLDRNMGADIMSKIRNDKHCIIKDKELAEALIGDRTVEVDYRQIWQDTLKQCLREGDNYTSVFEEDEFKENQMELDIDFKDPEIFRLAFDGFLNTLDKKNGEKSQSADWYYENIFANDPKSFLAMVRSYKESPGNLGIKGKITRFFKHNSQAFEDKVKADAEKRFNEEINSEQHAIKSSILRKATRGDIKKIIEAHKLAFIERMQKRAPEEVSTFIGQRTVGGREESEESKQKEVPFDFGYDKAHAMECWAEYIEEIIPNCNLEWFVDFFPGKEGQSFADRNTSSIDLSIWEKDDSYFGFSFEYEGKRCVIAESLNIASSMYLWRGELDENFKELFDYSKYDAKRTTDPRIADVDHLDKEHFDDSIDLAYKKAFLFFKTGDNSLMHYNHFKGDAKQRREKWHDNQRKKFPAFPLGVDNYSQYPEDIEGYQNWQRRQDEEKKRLKDAKIVGGPEMVRLENERIARENAERLYEEALDGGNEAEWA